MAGFFAEIDKNLFDNIIKYTVNGGFAHFVSLRFVNQGFLVFLLKSQYTVSHCISTIPVEAYSVLNWAQVYHFNSEKRKKDILDFFVELEILEIMTYCRTQAIHDNVEFFQHLTRNCLDFLKFMMNMYYNPSSAILVEPFHRFLKSKQKFGIFKLLFDNSNYESFGREFTIYRYYSDEQITQQEYKYVKVMLEHNFRNNLNVEKSCCTSCAKSPSVHRAWILRLLISQDDVELFKLYIEQGLRIPQDNGPRMHYTLQRKYLALIFIFNRKGIAKFLQERQFNYTFRQCDLQNIEQKASCEGIQLAQKSGLPIQTVRTLRFFLKSGADEKALLLINHPYEWQLAPQDRKHLLWRISQWKLETREKIQSKFWLSLLSEYSGDSKSH